PSPAVTVTLEVEPELEDAVGKLAAEAVAVGILPLPVDNLEGYVLVGWPGMEAQDGKVLVVLAGLQEVLGRRALVDEVRVEDVELVALHDLGGGVVEVIVGLVVLVPLEARVHTVEEAGLAWPVLVSPQIGLARERHLHAELRLIRAHALLGLTEEDVVALHPESLHALHAEQAALTCHLELLAQEQQPVRVLLSLQHVGVEGQLVGAQQPGAVLARVVVIQALLDQILLHQHGLPLCLSLGLQRTGTGMVPSFSAHLGSASGRVGAQGCPSARGAPGTAPGGCSPVTGGGRLPLDDGEEWLTLHTLLLLQLVQLLTQHVLVPLPQP
ncbi:Putative uncharacterized protein encoded by CACTIN-AS1, partial [Corvus brachyrhynchos]